MPSNERSIRSTESVDEYLVCFANRSTKDVELIWINYKGIEQRYITLKPKQYFKCKTFLTHPWIFRDSQTKRRLCFDTKPNVQIEEIQNNVIFVANEMPPNMTRVIHIFDPFPNLKEHCFEQMFRTIDPNQDIDALGIPPTVINQYRSYIKLFYT